MADRLKPREPYQLLLDQGIILSRDKAEGLIKNGLKTCEIFVWKTEQYFYIKFDKKSIQSFFEKIKEFDIYKNISEEKTHFTNHLGLLNNEVDLYCMPEKRDLPNAYDVLRILEKAPWLQYTSEYIASRITNHEAEKVTNSMKEQLKKA